MTVEGWKSASGEMTTAADFARRLAALIAAATQAGIPKPEIAAELQSQVETINGLE